MFPLAQSTAATQRRSFLQQLAALIGVNILPCITYIGSNLEFGRIRKYGGNQRVLCDSPAPGGNPAYRVFHLIDFHGDDQPTWVAHADFSRHPDYKLYFPTHEQQRKLDHLNS